MIWKMNVPEDIPQMIQKVRAGDRVLISGTLHTARDAAHKRLAELIREGKPLPIELQQTAVYYAGPCPAAEGEVIGPCGPTTSARMDPFVPLFVENGLQIMIGKGGRSADAISALKGKAVYLTLTGGAASLISSHILSCTAVAFEDLGPEAIYRLTVSDLIAVVAADAFGGCIFK